MNDSLSYQRERHQIMPLLASTCDYRCSNIGWLGVSCGRTSQPYSCTQSLVVQVIRNAVIRVVNSRQKQATYNVHPGNYYKYIPFSLLATTLLSECSVADKASTQILPLANSWLDDS